MRLDEVFGLPQRETVRRFDSVRKIIDRLAARADFRARVKAELYVTFEDGFACDFDVLTDFQIPGDCRIESNFKVCVKMRIPARRSAEAMITDHESLTDARLVNLDEPRAGVSVSVIVHPELIGRGNRQPWNLS